MAIVFNSFGNNQVNGGTTNTMTNMAAPNVGDTVIIGVGCLGSSYSVSTVTDSNGSTYTHLISANNGTAGKAELWACTNYVGGPNAFTVTVTLTTSPSGNWSVFGEGYTGVIQLGRTGTATGASTAPSVSVTTQDPDNTVVAVFAMGQDISGGTTGGTIRVTGRTAALADKSSITAGVTTNSGTTSKSGSWSAVAVELRSVLSAGAYTFHPEFPDFARAPVGLSPAIQAGSLFWEPRTISAFNPAQANWHPEYPDFARPKPGLPANKQLAYVYGGPTKIVMLRSAASAPSSTGTSVTISKPAGTIANDVLIACIFAGNPINTTLPTITPPTGWVQIRRDSHGTTSSMVMYYLVAGASEPTSYTWTATTQAGTGSAPVMFGAISAFINVDTVTPVDTSAGADSTTPSTLYGTPAITTTSTGTVLVMGWAGSE